MMLKKIMSIFLISSLIVIPNHKKNFLSTTKTYLREEIPITNIFEYKLYTFINSVYAQDFVNNHTTQEESHQDYAGALEIARDGIIKRMDERAKKVAYLSAGIATFGLSLMLNPKGFVPSFEADKKNPNTMMQLLKTLERKQVMEKKKEKIDKEKYGFNDEINLQRSVAGGSAGGMVMALGGVLMAVAGGFLVYKHATAAGTATCWADPFCWGGILLIAAGIGIIIMGMMSMKKDDKKDAQKLADLEKAMKKNEEDKTLYNDDREVHRNFEAAKVGDSDKMHTSNLQLGNKASKSQATLNKMAKSFGVLPEALKKALSSKNSKQALDKLLDNPKSDLHYINSHAKDKATSKAIMSAYKAFGGGKGASDFISASLSSPLFSQKQKDLLKKDKASIERMTSSQSKASTSPGSKKPESYSPDQENDFNLTQSDVDLNSVLDSENLSDEDFADRSPAGIDPEKTDASLDTKKNKNLFLRISGAIGRNIEQNNQISQQKVSTR